jgi:hypothetical protein
MPAVHKDCPPIKSALLVEGWRSSRDCCNSSNEHISKDQPKRRALRPPNASGRKPSRAGNSDTDRIATRHVAGGSICACVCGCFTRHINRRCEKLAQHGRSRRSRRLIQRVCIDKSLREPGSRDRLIGLRTLWRRADASQACAARRLSTADRVDCRFDDMDYIRKGGTKMLATGH